jgi:hypothetical protein
MNEEEVGSGFKARLEYVLDEVCRDLPGGGSHELRRCVAGKLAAAVDAGERSLESLLEVARQAMASPEAQAAEQRARS